MTGLTCSLLLCLLGAAAAPARADTFKGTAHAGPALAGDTVVWGEELADGRAVLYSRAPGRQRRALVRIAAAEGRGHTRGFGGVPGGVSASPTRTVYTLSELVTRSSGPDSATSTGSVTPLQSLAGGPFTNPLGTCVGDYVSTAVEGDRVAIAVNGGPPCAGVYVDGRKVSEAPDARQVRLAGRYVAWEEWPGGAGTAIAIADAATGALLARHTAPKDRSWGEFDIDERGTIVTIDRDRLVAFTVTDPRPRTLARRVGSFKVAAAGGRVAYITVDSDSGADRLVLADLTGKVVRRLERYGDRRRPIGEIALTDRRVAWSVIKAPYEATTGPGSVRTARL